MADAASRCLVCGEGLETQPRVWCTTCSTPAHKDCFAYNGRCAIFGCQGMRFRLTEDPRDRGVKWIEVRDEAGREVPQSYMVDFTSGREGATNVLIGLSLFAMLMFALPPKGARASAPFPYHETPFWISFAVGLISTVLRVGFNDYRIVDAKSKTIWLHSHFFGVRTTTVETTFAQVREVILSYRNEQYKGTWSRKWAVWLKMSDGSALKLTDEESQSIPGEDEPTATLGLESEKTATRIAEMVGLERAIWKDYVPAVER